MSQNQTKNLIDPIFVEKMNWFRGLPFEQQYIISLMNVLENGTVSKDRTGVGTKRIQSQQIHIDLTKGFPILRGKKMNFKSAFVEMMWIMTGRNDLKFLKDNGVNYWDSWVKEDGTFGPVYGVQMRNFGATEFPGVDQLKGVIDVLKSNPDSRRIMVSLWDPKTLRKHALPACHHDYQICSFIDHDGIRKMDLHIKQRSADSFLGVPYDLMLFAIYLYVVSIATNIPVNKIHITMTDYHMYLNHFDQVEKYIDNVVNDKLGIFGENEVLPQLQINFDTETQEVTDIDAFLEGIIENNFDIFELKNYENNHYPFIKAEVAV